MAKIDILSVKIDNVNLDEAVKKLDSLLTQKKPAIICTPNTEFIVTALKDADFKNILNKKSDLNIPDGFGLLWAAKFNTLKCINLPILREISLIVLWVLSIMLIPLLPALYKNPIRERVAGSDFVRSLAKYAAKNKLRIFLLGGAPTIAERTALQLQTEIPDLRVAGVDSSKSTETVKIIETIIKSKSEILLTAFGAPKQEKWLVENLSKTNCKIGIGIGGSFDFIAGVKKRAPLWMQKMGLEWLFRLVKEPSRIRRQLALPEFMWLILINRIKTK